MKILGTCLILCLALFGCGSEDNNGDPCEGVNCGANGNCDPDTGACQCDPGFTGSHCEPCADGYHMEGAVCVQDESLEIIGNYVDDWGGEHQITGSTWSNYGSVFHISQFDNEADFLIAQNDSANEFNPDLWSRFDWVFEGSDLYYCQGAYDAASEQDALSVDSADRGDLAAGCGGFGWSKLD